MRPRHAIEMDIIGASERAHRVLTIELLLDIRDLLTNVDEKTGEN